MWDDRLAIHEEGAGTPLLFLHALGASGRYWQAGLGVLAATHHCIMPDLLGFGDSPKPEHAAYTIEEHLAALTASLKSRGLDQPMIVVGHSLGAVLAVEYAARFPEAAHGLVVLGLPCYRNAAEARTFIGAHGDWFARATVANGRVAHFLCDLMHLIPTLSRRLAVAIAPPQFPRSVAEDSVKHTWPSYSRTLARCILHHDLGPALAAVSPLPILALHGTHDPAAPVEAVERLAREMPNLRLETLPGGHHLFLKQRAACVGAIARYCIERGRDDDA